jgi:hypothetical protein
VNDIRNILKNTANLNGEFRPENPEDQKKIKEMLSGMNQKDADKIMGLLQNPQEAQKLLQSPAAQKLIKMLSGDGNG